MLRSVIGWIGITKKSQIWSRPPQLNALCQIQRNSVVRCNAPNSRRRVPNSPEFIGSEENSSGRAFTSSDRSIIGRAI